GRAEESARRVSKAARRVLAQRVGAGRPGQPESEPRVRAPRRRLPRVRGAVDPRCAASPRIVRRTLPRGEPDAGRRGAARLRVLFVCRSLGVQRGREGAGAAQGTAAFRRGSSDAKELQVIGELVNWWLGELLPN